MIASERRLVTEGETRHSLTQKLALSGRPVKIYVIDPKQFQERFKSYNREEKKEIEVVQQPKRKEAANSRSKSNKVVTKRTVANSPVKVTNNVLIAPKESFAVSTQTQTAPTSTTVILSSNGLLPLPVISVPVLPMPIMGAAGVIPISTMPTSLVAAEKKEQPQPCVKKKPKPRKKKKASNNLDMSKHTNSAMEEKSEAAEMAYLMKETTTRTGRVSKSASLALASTQNLVTSATQLLSVAAAPAPMSPSFTGTISAASSPRPTNNNNNAVGAAVVAPQLQLIKKKREPPEKFRCQTCQRFYLGNAKFNQHFEKFPTHVKPDPRAKRVVKTKDKAPPPLVDLEPPLALEQMVIGRQVQDVNGSAHDPSSPKFKGISRENTDEDSLEVGACAFSAIRRSSVSAVYPDTLSDNCTSPKLPAFSVEPDQLFAPAQESQRMGAQDSLTSGLHRKEQQQPEYFLDFNNSISLGQIRSDIGGPGSCSQQSFNSLENLLADSVSHVCNSQPQLSVACASSSVKFQDIQQQPTHPNCSSVNTFFSTQRNSTNNNNNGSMDSNGNPFGESIPQDEAVGGGRHPIMRIDEESSADEHETKNLENHENCKGSSPSSSSSGNDPGAGCSRRKSIWEFVKEQIRSCGINQTCGEISEMAEKLSKIAREKFYPVQDEEGERRNACSPIIRVDTPFISHLLDLPLGRYIFREDGGMRKIIPPPTPVAAELSLTNGVEVDVDKFLSHDIDLISLPHLTNLDIMNSFN